MNELKQKLLRQFLHLETLLWMLLLGLALTVIAGMELLVSGLNYPLLVAVALGGLVLGRLLARIKAPWWLAILLITASGFQIVILIVGHLFTRIGAVVQAVFIYLFRLWQQNFMALPDPSFLKNSFWQLIQGSLVIFNRLEGFLTTLGQKRAADPLSVQLIWGWALWITMAWAAFLIWS